MNESVADWQGKFKVLFDTQVWQITSGNYLSNHSLLRNCDKVRACWVKDDIYDANNFVSVTYRLPSHHHSTIDSQPPTPHRKRWDLSKKWLEVCWPTERATDTSCFPISAANTEILLSPSVRETFLKLARFGWQKMFSLPPYQAQSVVLYCSEAWDRKFID